jgi:putative inorganic carbon (HCO3(-)) transporter
LEYFKSQTSHRKLSARLRGPWPLLGLAVVSVLNATPAQVLVLVGLGGWWAGQWGTGRMAWPVPWAAAPAGALLGMTVVGLLVSPDWAVSLPKLAGLWLDLTIGAAAYWALSADGERGLDARQSAILPLRGAAPPQSAIVLAGLGAALALATPFTADFAGKVSSLLPGAWARSLPNLVPGLTRDSFGNVQAGIHANELGGTLALLLPFALALLLLPGTRTVGGRRLPPAVFLTVVALIGAALLLLGSRSGLLGALAGAGVVIWWARPRWRGGYVLAAGLLIVAGVALALLRAEDPASVDTVSFRLELWARTVPMIRDAPFTGIGLNAFPLVQPDLYPILRHEATGFVAHAHNVYLQTAVDLGVPGLIAFLALLAGVAGAARRGLAGVPLSPLLLGAAGSLVAWGGHGLVDAITLGAKPVVLVGLCAGILLGSDPRPAPLRRGDLGRLAAQWVLWSLIIIGVLEWIPWNW